MTSGSSSKPLSSVWRKPSGHLGIELASLLKASATIVGSLGEAGAVPVAWSGTKESYSNGGPSGQAPSVYLSPEPLQGKPPFSDTDVDVIIGLAIHEAAHVKRANWRKGTPSETILEEVMIDAMAAQNPIAGEYLARARQAYWDKYGQAEAYAMLVNRAVYQPVRSDIQALWAGIAIYGAPIPSNLPREVIAALWELVSLAQQATQPRANLVKLGKKADAVLDEFADTFTPPPLAGPEQDKSDSGEPSGEPGGNSAGDSAEDASNDGADNDQSGDGQDDQPEDDPEDNPDESAGLSDQSEPDPDQVDSDTGQNSGPDEPEDDPSDDSDPPDAAPDPFGSPADFDLLDMLCIRDQDKHSLKAGEADALREALEYSLEDLQSEADALLKSAGISGSAPTIVLSHQPEPAHLAAGYLKKVEAKAGELAQVFQELKRRQTRNVRGLEQGKVSPRRLHRAGIGDPHLFQKKELLGQLDLGVVLLLDNSSSIDPPEWALMREMAALAVRGLEGVPGLSLAVIGYDGAGDSMRLMRLYDREFPSFVLGEGSRGGTPSGDAMLGVFTRLDRLVGPKRQKLIIHITDGQPNSVPVREPGGYEQEIVTLLRRQGVSVMSVYVGRYLPTTISDLMNTIYGPHAWQHVPTFRDLPKAVREMLREEVMRLA